MKYSNKKTTIATENSTVTVRHLNPIEANLLTIKCISAITPSLCAVIDGISSEDRSLTMSTAGQLFIQNMDSDQIHEIMLQVLGGIENMEGQPLGNDPERINEWFAYHPDYEMLDIFAEVFEESIVKKILNSKIVKRVLPKVEEFKEMLTGDTGKADAEV